MASPMFVVLIFACIFLAAFANVIELTADTFGNHVDGSSNILVEFYAPWCGHCKNLAPEWKLAAETFQPTDDIKFAAFDATAGGSLADKYGVKGYPTIKYFPKGSTSPQEFEGGRTADSIVKWVNGKIGTARKIKLAPSSVVTLNSDNFDSMVLGSKAALVEFYAPWCGHCKQLAPKYEKVGSIFAGDSEVVVAKVDATEEPDLASRYEISGYPTIKFFPAGSNVPEDYNGGREIEDFVEFLNEQVGTQRTADGGLKSIAGRVDSLDEIVKSANFNVDNKVADELAHAVNALAGNESGFGKIYVSIAQKIVSKGAGYVGTEIARLGKMLSTGNVKPDTKKNFQLRLNILKAFAKQNEEL